jgi:hypothetical protein
MSKGSGPTLDSARVLLEAARDELYSHILRCGVIDASDDQRGNWFDDTIGYIAERYPDLTPEQLAELRDLGEQFCKPVIPYTTK